MLKGSRLVRGLVVFGILSTASAARAQTSGIAGVLRDTSGAVLPGVTIEVSSPALIERTRSTTSDGNGQYQFVELVPGAYKVTFTLPGFATVQREGIQLTAGFVATVNAEMRVGAVSETITVSGASPVVDTRSVLQQEVMTRQVIEAVPTDKQWANLAAFVPGMNTSTHDTGGTAGSQRQHLQVHGGRSFDQYIEVYGMSIGFGGVSGPSPLIYPDGSTEEISIATGGHNAENETAGIRVSIIPKSGSNSFRGNSFGSYTNGQMQADVLNDRLRTLGLLAADRAKYVSDFNPSFGGPVVRDRLWFHTAYRNWRVVRRSPVFYDTDVRDWKYEPDLKRETVPARNLQQIGTLNTTWQATPKNKINVNWAHGKTCECELFLSAAGITLEGSMYTFYPYDLVQTTWTSPVSEHVLLDFGASAFLIDHDVRPQPTAVGPPALERTTGFSFRARTLGAASNYNNPNTFVKWNNYTLQGAASYVTGAHHVKGGMIFNPKPEDMYRYPLSGCGVSGTDPCDYQVNLINGQPSQVVFAILPLRAITNTFSLAGYLQDQWTYRRFTLHGGLRYDEVWVSYPAVTSPATRLLPERSFPEQNRVIDRKDLSPRMGLSWDLFGTGRTAIKAYVGRYVLNTGEEHNQAVSQHPVVTTSTSATRTFTDRNGDFIPDGDPLNPNANGELGVTDNRSFGSSVPTFRLDPDWRHGWFKRQYQWEMSASVDHEVAREISIAAGYFRRVYGNQARIVNMALSPTDMDPYCVTAYSDPRLPGGGGRQICGLYDVNPSKVGVLQQVQTLSSNYGKQTEYYDGVDFTASVRRGTALLQGGVNIGRSVFDDCDVTDNNPQLLAAGASQEYCRKIQPWLPDFKVLSSWNLPKEFQVAAGFQSKPGLTSTNATNFGVNALAIYSSSQIAPSLGRNLSAGPTAAVSIDLVSPGSVLADRTNQLDLRGAKGFAKGRRKLRVMVDVYNVLNSGPALGLIGTYGTTGATWLRPSATLEGRLLKFGAQLDF